MLIVPKIDQPHTNSFRCGSPSNALTCFYPPLFYQPRCSAPSDANRPPTATDSDSVPSTDKKPKLLTSIPIPSTTSDHLSSAVVHRDSSTHSPNLAATNFKLKTNATLTLEPRNCESHLRITIGRYRAISTTLEISTLNDRADRGFPELA
jgi:hypothetical protein